MPLALRARARLWILRDGPRLVLAGSAIVLLERVLEPPRPRMGEAVLGPVGEAEVDPATAPLDGWKWRRDMLRRAGERRRAGAFDDALRDYARVMRAADARASDRASARMWHARIRLDRGESSALVDLNEMVHEHVDPALNARIAQAAMRFAARRVDADADAKWTAFATSLRARCESALARKSLVHDEDGARATRWLRLLRRE